MLAGNGYTQILEMIMKRLQPSFIQGSGYAEQHTQLPNVDGTTGNPYDPKSLDGFSDYDYHLVYNEEDELTSFTSNDGKISFTLNKDDYEDLVNVLVTTPLIKFKIVLVYENYNAIQGDPPTEEKGKIVEAIITMENGQLFPIGLYITPSRLTASIGQTVTLTAMVEHKTGEAVDCTNSAEWSVNDSQYTITNGVISNVQLGKFQVCAKYNGCVAYADITVTGFLLVMEPNSSVVELEVNTNQTVSYKLYRVDTVTKAKLDVTTEATWSVSKWTGVINASKYDVTINTTGDAVVTATYKGEISSSNIHVINK